MCFGVFDVAVLGYQYLTLVFEIINEDDCDSIADGI
jgi:hypothetical protein